MVQNDDPSGPNMDMAPGSLQEKKMDVDKRGMGMSDYNGDMRKGGRGGGGGMGYRQPAKEASPGDPGSYYDKVGPAMPPPCPHLDELLVLSHWSLPPLVVLPCLFRPPLPPSTVSHIGHWDSPCL